MTLAFYGGGGGRMAKGKGMRNGGGYQGTKGCYSGDLSKRVGGRHHCRMGQRGCCCGADANAGSACGKMSLMITGNKPIPPGAP